MPQTLREWLALAAVAALALILGPLAGLQVVTANLMQRLSPSPRLTVAR